MKLRISIEYTENRSQGVKATRKVSANWHTSKHCDKSNKQKVSKQPCFIAKVENNSKPSTTVHYV